MEDWDAESSANQSASFTLQQTTRPFQQQRPKDHFLKYLKNIHGRSTAARIQAELDSLKITNTNFNAWKTSSLNTKLREMDCPPEDLMNRRQ